MMAKHRSRFALLLFAAPFLLIFPSVSQSPHISEKAEIPHFRNTAPSVHYVGSKVCATCHSAIYKQFLQTDMGNSMFAPAKLLDLGWLSQPVDFFNQRHNRHYRIFSRGPRVFQSEYQIDASGQDVFRHTEELSYVIGTGVNGATPIVRRGNYFFQAPISYYSATKSWDLSPNYETRDFAFSLPITSDCVGCHSGRIQPVRDREALYQEPPVIEPAIGCERCHGPGELHASERIAGAPLPPGGIDTAIVNPRKLPPWLADNICMNCHEGDIRVFQQGKSWEDFRPGTALNDTVFILKPPIDPQAAQSPLLEHYYSMTLSKCYRASAGKLGCQTCHDPHIEPSAAEAPKYFREKCLQCHTEKSCTLNVHQRLAQQPQDSCSSCHMAKKPALTVSHSTLTDHRILRTTNQSYPQSAFAESLPGTGFIHVNAIPGKTDAVPEITLLKAYRKELMRGELQFKDHYFATLDHLEASGSTDPFVLSAVAQKAGSDGNLPKAIRFAKQALEGDSSSDSGYLLLEGFLARSGDLSGSVEVLKKGIGAFPFSDALYQALAVRQLSGGNVTESAAIQHGLELFPENAVLREANARLSSDNDLQQAQAKFKQGDVEGATAELQAAIEADPKNARAHDALGIVLGESGKLDEATIEFQKAAEIDPAFPDPHFHLGLAYLKKGRIPDATSEYQRALRLNPGMVEAEYGLSEICGKLGDIEGAITLLRLVTRAEPDFAEAHFNLGLNLWNRYKKTEALKQQSDLDQSAQELGRAAELNPQGSRIWFALGQLLADKGDLTPAVADLEKAVDLEPGNPEYHYNLGLAMRQSGNLTGAIEQFRSALKITSELPLAHRSLGLALREIGDLDAAASELHEAVAQLPDDAQCHHLLGTVLLKQNKFDAAIAELQKAVDLDPNLTDARASLAQTLQKAGRKQESQQQAAMLRTVNENASNVGQAMILMQTAAEQSNRKEYAAAVKTLQSAVALDPALTEAQYQLSMALKQSGDY